MGAVHAEFVTSGCKTLTLTLTTTPTLTLTFTLFTLCPVIGSA